MPCEYLLLWENSREGLAYTTLFNETLTGYSSLAAAPQSDPTG